MPLTDSELYKGFSQDKIDRYNQEIRESYDPALVEQVDRKIRGLSKKQWQAVLDEGSKIASQMADRMDQNPSDPPVQSLMARQHAWIENFFPVNRENFIGLGDLYATNEEFRAYYDQYAPDLADFMQQAMKHYAENTLTSKE